MNIYLNKGIFTVPTKTVSLGVICDVVTITIYCTGSHAQLAGTLPVSVHASTKIKKKI